MVLLFVYQFCVGSFHHLLKMDGLTTILKFKEISNLFQKNFDVGRKKTFLVHLFIIIQVYFKSGRLN